MDVLLDNTGLQPLIKRISNPPGEYLGIPEICLSVRVFLCVQQGWPMSKHELKQRQPCS